MKEWINEIQTEYGTNNVHVFNSQYVPLLL